MVLADAFSAVLTGARELISDPAVKQAIADDLALVESKAGEGIAALETHIASWFGAHYALPVPAASAPEPAAAPADAVPGAAGVPANVPQQGTFS